MEELHYSLPEFRLECSGGFNCLNQKTTKTYLLIGFGSGVRTTEHGLVNGGDEVKVVG